MGTFQIEQDYNNKNQIMQPVPPFPARREGMGMGQMNKIIPNSPKESAHHPWVVRGNNASVMVCEKMLFLFHFGFYLAQNPQLIKV